MREFDVMHDENLMSALYYSTSTPVSMFSRPINHSTITRLEWICCGPYWSLARINLLLIRPKDQHMYRLVLVFARNGILPIKHILVGTRKKSACPKNQVPP